MFRRLRTKLTVLYAGLFAGCLIGGALLAYTAVADNAQRAVRDELQAGGAVFDRIWALRSRQLREGADLLSRDFGFREAVATRDDATMRSALDNLRVRFGVDTALIVDTEGRVSTADGRPAATDAAGLLAALEAEDGASGVLMLNGAPHQAISAPILSPTLMGWVVFAVRLDQAEMSSLEKLAAIPLEAEVFHRAQGRWSGGPDGARLGGFIDGRLQAADRAPAETVLGGERNLVLVKPLKTLGARTPAALVLRYPMARALQPYHRLLETLFGVGAIGFALLLVATWALARGVTKPISVLDDAAQRLQSGEDVQVEVDTADEIGRLAESFNAMSAEIRERERRITHQALHDQESGLPNRLSLERAVQARLGQPEPMFVAALGVERFVQVRGAIGYAAAAALVRELGARLAAAGPALSVGRLTGDVVGLGFRAADAEAAQAFAEDLRARLERPVTIDGHTIDVGLAIGLAGERLHGDAAPALIERADIALAQARAAGRKLAMFDLGAYGDPTANLSLMSEMLRGLERGDIALHHQPKYDLRRQAVVGVEALTRWRHPTRGPLAPDLFIPMAEETGHIRELTEWALRRAIEDQAALHDAGHPVTMSVNLSGRLLGDESFAIAAEPLLARARGTICFEITETAVMDNPDAALRSIDRLAAAGAEISIDDYGSGLSSLAYLRRIPAKELKIDKAFVTPLAESGRDALLVRSTIDLAHGLGLKVTAEGVETPAALALLAGMGCDLAQGYLIARPLPLADLIAFLGRASALQQLQAKAS